VIWNGRGVGKEKKKEMREVKKNRGKAPIRKPPGRSTVTKKKTQNGGKKREPRRTALFQRQKNVNFERNLLGREWGTRGEKLGKTTNQPTGGRGSGVGVFFYRGHGINLKKRREPPFTGRTSVAQKKVEKKNQQHCQLLQPQ